jgi:hypothetical protein
VGIPDQFAVYWCDCLGWCLISFCPCLLGLSSTRLVPGLDFGNLGVREFRVLEFGVWRLEYGVWRLEFVVGCFWIPSSVLWLVGVTWGLGCWNLLYLGIKPLRTGRRVGLSLAALCCNHILGLLFTLLPLCCRPILL